MKKCLIVTALLLATIAICFGLPKPRYQSPDILPTLDVPLRMKDWRGRDVSGEFNPKDARYNFISNIFARVYANYLDESLLLLILDAGNFHNPKVCFGSSGYKAVDLPDTEFKTSYSSFKANTVYFQKGDEGLLIIYWICINKKVVDWTRQKMIQLWYSMFNKEKVGLMVRFELRATKEKIPSAIRVAREFVAELDSALSKEQAEYIFGK